MPSLVSSSPAFLSIVFLQLLVYKIMWGRTKLTTHSTKPPFVTKSHSFHLFIFKTPSQKKRPDGCLISDRLQPLIYFSLFALFGDVWKDGLALALTWRSGWRCGNFIVYSLFWKGTGDWGRHVRSLFGAMFKDMHVRIFGRIANAGVGSVG